MGKRQKNWKIIGKPLENDGKLWKIMTYLAQLWFVDDISTVIIPLRFMGSIPCGNDEEFAEGTGYSGGKKSCTERKRLKPYQSWD